MSWLNDCIDCECIGEACVWHKYPGEKLEIKACVTLMDTEYDSPRTSMNWHHNGICCLCESRLHEKNSKT